MPRYTNKLDRASFPRVAGTEIVQCKTLAHINLSNLRLSCRPWCSHFADGGASEWATITNKLDKPRVNIT